MKPRASSRRRPSVHITLGRASRLHKLVVYLGGEARARDTLLAELNIGLRTFYRELELLKKCGVKVRLEGKSYALKSTTEEAEGRLPFPDPQLSFAEMTELSAGTGEAAKRLAALLAQVTGTATAKPRGKRTPKSSKKS